MNIAFALFRYFPFGGLQRDMAAIAAELVARGHAVTVFTRDWQGGVPDGISVKHLPVRALSNHAADARFAEQVQEHWRDFDVRVGFNKMDGLDFYYAADGCLAARYGNSLKNLLPRYRVRLAQEAAVFAAGLSTRILSISPPQRQLYRQCHGTESARFVDLPPGIRRDRRMPDNYAQRRQQWRQQQGLADEARLLLFVGSGFRTKGLDRALQAAAGVLRDNDRFVVIGADRASRYQRQAQALGIGSQVHFLGGQDRIPEWLWAADLLLHPAYAENTGTVLLEAAIAGVPVLTTEVCGYAPYIEQAQMGTVLRSETITAQVLVASAEALLQAPRGSWWPRARAFADSADIYSLVAHAADAITGERA